MRLFNLCLIRKEKIMMMIIIENTMNIRPIMNKISIAECVTFHGIKIIPKTHKIIPIDDNIINNISIVKALHELKHNNKFTNLKDILI
jgi:hypothetical protein